MSIWAQCTTILNALKKHRYAWPFLEPVDTVALNIPDYHDVVKQPMDLGTVSKKVAHEPEKGIGRQYRTPVEFRDDVRLVWSNCRAYNRPGQDVRAMGDFLSEMWEKRWCQSEIEDKWNLEEGNGNDQVRFRCTHRIYSDAEWHLSKTEIWFLFGRRETRW